MRAGVTLVLAILYTLAHAELRTALLLSDNGATAKHSAGRSHYPFTILGELQYI